MISNNPKSPRQRMINLMYLVFIAMLALNVPTEVLDGFDLVEEGLQQTIQSSETQNKLTISNLTDINNQNPKKAGEQYAKARIFINESDSLFNYIQNLKLQIAKETDGKNANVDDIKNRENLDASTKVMLSEKDKKGERLKSLLDSYRQKSVNLVDNKTKKSIIETRLNTDVPKKGKLDNRNWQETFFEQMPSIAAITLLTKIQNDIRATQGDVLSDLLNNIEGRDFKVNEIRAEVIPESEFVSEGGMYQGRVVLTAVDTTKRPTFNIPSIHADGSFKIPAGSAGSTKIFEGILTLSNSTGDMTITRPFRSEYHVVPRIVAIQPELTNVLYRGRNNPLTISVPGMSSDQFKISATNGQISRSGNSWVAKPGSGNTMDITISDLNGKIIDKKVFKIRSVPDPAPYIDIVDQNGVNKRFKGGRIAKSDLIKANTLKAAIDDGILDEQFPVMQFTMTFYDAMGNGIRELSDGANFTEKQKSLIRQVPRGKTIYITSVKTNVYGEERTEDRSAMELRVF